MPGSSTTETLTERRKAATRLDIARTAAALFVEDGLRATRAEDIARAAGVAPRTFYRYFATKEEAVAPLFAAGAQRWAEAVRDAPAALSVPEALRHAVAQSLTADDAANVESLEWVRSLLRMAAESPALQAVWGTACHASEATLLAVLAERVGAITSGGSGGSGDLGRSGGAGGASDSGGVGAHDGSGASQAPASLALRMAAGVACTAIRVGVETWAASDAPVDGELGPAALAARCLASLGDFPWAPA
ncbi:TetR family transcriptional regulator [Streptomyces sp. CB01635]|uniref:TetR family transcriptional regulator n=1 Tax=unclassified Streptomyces TaxID=2593676 RepID=UPI000C272D45|nr:TetR family transcriptional regulator [Streptomyces sp. CB01635]PJN08727.1 TetR family transcriptional regulator [Streptomyces sp. CB01635]